MSSQNSTSMLRSGFFVALLVQVIAIVVTLAQTPGPALWTIVRAAALFGYVALFWAIVSSEYMRELRKLFGRPFLKLHHSLTVAAWVLILTHPLAYVILAGSPTVLVPIFSPLSSFLQWAGRTALYLFALATIAGLLRKSLKRYWKYVHKLNYVAFLLVFVHAWLIGTDLSSMLLRILWVVMAAVVLLVAVHKAVGTRQARR
jgi:DMSO/TMAO reductase YedYZ heme-binding membrane subunit